MAYNISKVKGDDEDSSPDGKSQRAGEGGNLARVEKG